MLSNGGDMATVGRFFLTIFGDLFIFGSWALDIDSLDFNIEFDFLGDGFFSNELSLLVLEFLRNY